jgi:phosphoglycolate phosphatase-like HAD superfamily hydrolase
MVRHLSPAGALKAASLALLLAATPALAAMPVRSAPAPDVLPSWKEGPSKRAILAFVERVSRPGSADYVPPAERIATFDNDGTLWPETPLPFQLLYALDTLRERVKQEPALRADPMVQAALGGDLARLLEGPRHEGLLRVLALTHAGMTTEEFRASVQRWLATARHPRYGRPYDRLAYQPMLELLRHLRANGFRTFIVSGGGADFLRVWSERVYGIPPEQVVGSTALTRFELREGKPVLVKTTDHLFVNDKAGKPVGIHAFIGRRPIAAFGNSDGDLQMLQYTTMANPRPALGLLVHHTDARREVAYDAHPPSTGRLVEALRQAPKRGWVVVDMAKDWTVLFASP